MPSKLKDMLKGKLTPKEIGLVPSSFDRVGKLIIFSDFPKSLFKKEKVIGNEILKNFNQIKSVFKKTKKHSGKFRTPQLKLIYGNKSKETLHKENNVILKLNIEKVYFSTRLSEERKRLAKKIKSKESALVMFSGCGVYPLVIAKNTKAKLIYGIEISPAAHKYALENLKINKLESKVNFYLGDVKKVLPQINNKFDHIIMPLPKGAENFLGLALNKVKKKGMIHLYSFSEEGKYEVISKIIKQECIKAKKECKIIDIVKCGQFSPRVSRICVDFRVN
jgi:tRNA (guanine37-N1)-methyltransferase